MCTVTYLPLEKNGFILTSNRDETLKRQPDGIFHDVEKGLYYPKEPVQGGTWISVAENNRILCLLNGAFTKHRHQPPYKRSRGLVALDFFDYPTPADFYHHYNFEGIEPFTLIIFDNGNLYNIRWDGTLAHLATLDVASPHIWSSSSLYSDEVKQMRQTWFDTWLQSNPSYNAADILYFHQNAGTGDVENDLIMSRFDGKLCTVSHTQIIKKSDFIQMYYFDRVSGNEYRQNISINRTS